MKKKTKFLLLRASIIAIFALLAGRVWYLQVVMANYYKHQADTSKIRVEPVDAFRGIIYDRNGRNLVWNTPSWSVYIVPDGIPSRKAPQIYSKLSSLLRGRPSAHKISQIVARNSWRPYAPVLIKQDVTDAKAMIIKQLHAELPGVQADPSSIRHYSLDVPMSLSHLLGYTGQIAPDQFTAYAHTYPKEHVGADDQAGRAGVEAALDPYLHGVNGSAQVEVDAGERPVRTLKTIAPVPGDNVYLTIDAQLQRQVSDDLAAALNKLHLRKGIAVVEDVRNGQILAMVSLPSYDDNVFARGIRQREYTALLHDPDQPLNDMAIAGQYPPGSTYKVISAAAALQSGAVNANTTVYDTGSIKLCDGPAVWCTIYGWNPAGLGPMNVVSALAESSDIYFYTVTGGPPNDSSFPHSGATVLAHFARLFGIGSPLGIELPGEAAGFVPTPAWFNRLPIGPLRAAGSSWHLGDTYHVAIGQGQDLATPLQMANVAATIANGGTLYQPHIVDRITGRLVPRRGALAHDRVLQPFVPTIIRRQFIDPQNISLIQQGMHHSVDWPVPTGTSFNVQDGRIDAAGKTGTAEAPGGAHSWWIGYAPYKDPQIAVAVVIPNANSEGAYTAAPIAHKIFEDYFHLPPTKSNWLDDVEQNLLAGAATQ